jgi:hypothetical protein
MEIQGKVSILLPPQMGTGKNGTWKKQDFILETEGQVSRKISFSVWGEKIDQFNLNVGDTVTVFFDLESREYNGKWYTDAKAWKVTKQDSATNSNPRTGQSSSIPASDDIIPESSGEDDLPF